MKTKMVKIGKDVYKLTAVTADISGAVAIELMTDFAPLIISFLDGNTEALNKEVRISGKSDKLMRILQELINFNILEKNNELVQDWKEEFSCKPFTMFQLGYEALRLNCEDFFTFISGFVNENKIGQNLRDTILNLKKEGVEIPPLFSLLIQNGEETTQEKQEK